MTLIPILLVRPSYNLAEALKGLSRTLNPEPTQTHCHSLRTLHRNESSGHRFNFTRAAYTLIIRTGIHSIGYRYPVGLGNSMEAFLQRANHFFEQLPDITRRYRWWVWLGFLLINVAIISGAARFKIDMTMDAYFQKDDPVKQAYDTFRAQFGSDEVLVIVYEPKDGDLFSPTSLTALKGLQDELLNYRLGLSEGEHSELDHITDVTSIINASFMESRGDDLLSRPFIGDQLPVNKNQSDQLRQVALAHPDYPLTYFSKDSTLGAIIVKTDFGATPLDEAGIADTDNLSKDVLDNETSEIDMDAAWDDSAWDDGATQAPPVEFKKAEVEDYSRFMAVIDPILAKPAYSDHLGFYPVGNPSVMSFFGNVIMKEMAIISGLSILLIGAVLWLLFRSLSAVVWSLAIVVISFLWSIGLASVENYFHVLGAAQLIVYELIACAQMGVWRQDFNNV